MYLRNRRGVRRQVPNNAIDEARGQSGLAGFGNLPEDQQQYSRPPLLTPSKMSGGNPTLNVPLGPAPPPPPSRIFAPQALSTYIVAVPAGAAVAVYAATRERSYSLIVNGGAGAAVIAYGRVPASATDGIPLAAANGYHELVYGTTSTVFAFSAADTFFVVTEGRYDPTMEF